MPSNMNDHQSQQDDGQQSRGPNLVLIYSLLGAALIAAMAIAVLIVLPFYRHH
jgi:hypothetical protein